METQLSGRRRALTQKVKVVPEPFNDPNDNKLLAVPERAAMIVGRSTRTIYAWIQDGRVKVRYAQGGAVLVEVASLFTSQRPETARTTMPDQPAA